MNSTTSIKDVLSRTDWGVGGRSAPTHTEITDTDTVTEGIDRSDRGSGGKGRKEGSRLKSRTSRSVDAIADKLVHTFDNPDRRRYYCRVAWRLPEGTIWRLAEQAQNGHSPAKLFTALCQEEMTP